MKILETVLKLGFPFVIDIVKKVLLGSSNEANKTAGNALDAITHPPTQEEVDIALQKTDVKKIKEINKTMQKEIASKDGYVRRMRPTFGYCICLTWTIQMGVLGYIMVTDTDAAIDMLSALEGLSVIWSVGLSVLGVYVYKRSHDKRDT